MIDKLSAIQMVSEKSPEKNIFHLRDLLTELSPAKNQLVLLPENALCFADKVSYLKVAEPLGDGPLQSELATLAKQYQCYLICGSFPIKCPESSKIHTTMLVFSAQGKLISHYHKLHLFDALVADKKGLYKESDTFIPGHEIRLFDWPLASSKVVKVGLAICYDLRFPALFQTLREQGAEVILIAAAFTRVTGKAHWQALLQARAIENQCFIIAANQGGKDTFGHSMIISPWGEILTQLEYGEGVIQAVFDKLCVDEVREGMPVALHNRFIHSLK